MGGSPDAPFFRLSRLLGCAALTGQGSAQRVRQGRRIAGAAASAGRARPARTTAVAPTSGSCIPCGARPIAPVAPPPRTGRDGAAGSARVRRRTADQRRVARRPRVAGGRARPDREDPRLLASRRAVPRGGVALSPADLPLEDDRRISSAGGGGSGAAAPRREA